MVCHLEMGRELRERSEGWSEWRAVGMKPCTSLADDKGCFGKGCLCKVVLVPDFLSPERRAVLFLLVLREGWERVLALKEIYVLIYGRYFSICYFIAVFSSK